MSTNTILRNSSTITTIIIIVLLIKLQLKLSCTIGCHKISVTMELEEIRTNRTDE